jgi:hypothetical protein
MRFDIENQLSVIQSFVATAVSTNSYQKQTAAQDISIGRRMSLLVLCTVAAGAGSSHVLECIQADDAALTSNVNSVNALPAIAAANLVPGTAFEIPIPQGTLNQQFIGFRDTITGGTTTVTLDVYLVPADEIPKYKSFVNVVPTLV